MKTISKISHNLSRLRLAFSSRHAFHEAIVLKSSVSSLINEDLVPSPPNRQTWTTWNYFAYWWSESWCVSTWAVGASFISLGATIRDALLVVFFANALSALVIVANGRAAARYHVGFPVLARATFGIYGHYFVVVLRSMLGIIWAGINMYFTGQFISICLRCIFTGWEHLPNTIPSNQHITSQGLLGFFLAFVATLPFVFIHTSKIMGLFTIKSIVMPLAGLGVVLWSTLTNGGIDSKRLEDSDGPRIPPTAVLAWGIISQFNAVIGINSALLVTVPDLARYSKTTHAQVWGQLMGLPLGQTLCGAFGVISTVC
jgi:NCS1 family nucleobase:cation symporter-1